MGKKRLAIFLILILVCTSTMCLVACTRSSKYENAFTVGCYDLPQNLNPYSSSLTANTYVTSLLYDTLLSSWDEPYGYEEGEDYYFDNGDKYEPASEDNYFLFEDNLFYMEGAYERAEDSEYGWVTYTPTTEEYEAKLAQQGIVYGEDELGVANGETWEEFLVRREEAVPSDNWMEYRFAVRDGYTWSDGEAFTASDVEFTFKYAIKYSGQLATISYLLDSYYDCWVEDDGDFVLQLATNKISDIKTICNSIVIIPEHIWTDIRTPASEKNLNPVGTGTYTLAEDGYIEDQSIALQLREDYSEVLLAEEFAYDPIEYIFLRGISDENVMLNAIQTGDIDYCLDSITTQRAMQISASASYSNVLISEAPSAYVTTMVFNLGANGVFSSIEDSLLIRQAISLAIDQQSLIDNLLYGKGELVGDGLVASSEPHALTDDNGDYVYHTTDLELANQILDNLGYTKDSSGMRDLSFEITAGSTDSEVIINYIGTMLKENLGITVTFKLQSTDYSEWIKQRNNPDFDMILNTVTLTSDKLLMFDARFGTYANGSVRTWNVSGVSSEELSELMLKMDTCIDIEQQYAYAQEVQEMLGSLYAEIPLYIGYTHSLYTDANFTGWTLTASGGIMMKYLQLA